MSSFLFEEESRQRVGQKVGDHSSPVAECVKQGNTIKQQSRKPTIPDSAKAQERTAQLLIKLPSPWIVVRRSPRRSLRLGRSPRTQGGHASQPTETSPPRYEGYQDMNQAEKTDWSAKGEVVLEIRTPQRKTNRCSAGNSGEEPHPERC